MSKAEFKALVLNLELINKQMKIIGQKMMNEPENEKYQRHLTKMMIWHAVLESKLTGIDINVVIADIRKAV